MAHSGHKGPKLTGCMSDSRYSAADYAARVRAARGYAGLDREDIAKALNLSVRTYSRIESGERLAEPTERMTIAELCSVPPLFMEIGWDLAAPVGDETISDEEVTRAAALLAPQLLAAARALRRAPGSAPRSTGGPGRPRRAAEGGGA